jgi:hypothetical protein
MPAPRRFFEVPYSFQNEDAVPVLPETVNQIARRQCGCFGD